MPDRGYPLAARGKPGSPSAGMTANGSIMRALITVDQICKVLVVPDGYEGRRAEIAGSVVTAMSIVSDFAAKYGWSAYLTEPFFNSVEIYLSHQALWRRILDLNRQENIPMPTDALTAALEKNVLAAIVYEEAKRTRPEYFLSWEDWTRALSHEIIHRLHIRLLDGDEDAMGPRWFFESFAIIGSGQLLGKDLQAENAGQAIEFAHSEGRGSYAKYAAALRFFAQRTPLPKILARAGGKDFEEWLRSTESDK
jgi:hypothetical protein